MDCIAKKGDMLFVGEGDDALAVIVFDTIKYNDQNYLKILILSLPSTQPEIKQKNVPGTRCWLHFSKKLFLVNGPWTLPSVPQVFLQYFHLLLIIFWNKSSWKQAPESF